jgi:hypothetical protein
MGLFKSKEERRIEREMLIRRGVKAIERSIAEQGKFTEQFIKNAQQAKKVGDDQQYKFIREQLKKTTSIKRMLERQLVAINSAIILQKQASASGQFAASMSVIAEEIGKTFGELDLTKTQVEWERAVTQSQSIEERMGLFLDSMETSANGQSLTQGAAQSSQIADAEIDRMIEADVLAAEQAELGKLDALESEIERELARGKA